jgi:SpoVK/Ycf46/Vps4 family AAA+-type ATPase
MIMATLSNRQKPYEWREVKLVKSQEKMALKIAGIIKFFFKGKARGSLPPFRGFLLEGPPGSGKTQIAWQAALIAGAEPVMVDSSNVATPMWGEAEKKLRGFFEEIRFTENRKKVLIFDDIDCLMLKRGLEVAKEWHYSINSVLFHLLDTIDPYQRIVIATTNRPDLIDEALRSRLYSLSIPVPPLEELIEIAENLLRESGVTEDKVPKIVEKISSELRKMNSPTIRTVQHLVIRECVEGGLWVF